MLSGGSPGTWDTPGQTGIHGPLRARALQKPGPACPEVVRPGLLCGYRREPLAAWAYADDFFSGSWSCLETGKLSDISAELKGLGLHTEIGKFAWKGTGIDELAPRVPCWDTLHQGSTASVSWVPWSPARTMLW